MTLGRRWFDPIGRGRRSVVWRRRNVLSDFKIAGTGVGRGKEALGEERIEVEDKGLEKQTSGRRSRAVPT